MAQHTDPRERPAGAAQCEGFEGMWRWGKGERRHKKCRQLIISKLLWGNQCEIPLALKVLKILTKAKVKAQIII